MSASAQRPLPAPPRWSCAAWSAECASPGATAPLCAWTVPTAPDGFCEAGSCAYYQRSLPRGPVARDKEAVDCSLHADGDALNTSEATFPQPAHPDPSLAPTTLLAAVQRAAVTVKLFVYQPPAELVKQLTPRRMLTKGDMFLENELWRLLPSHCFTMNASEADFYVVNTSLASATFSAGMGTAAMTRGLTTYVSRGLLPWLMHIRNAYPYFNRSGGEKRACPFA